MMLSVALTVLTVLEGPRTEDFKDPKITTINIASHVAATGRVQKTEALENNKPALVFTHGNIAWLSELALKAGWPEETHSKLGQIILRESGGCPNRRGGDIVDKNCNITGVSEWNHRSDTGLLQINGVNYDISRNKWALLCRELGICTQEPLLEPYTNLRAGYALYLESGWAPWDPCTWDKKRCPKKKP